MERQGQTQRNSVRDRQTDTETDRQREEKSRYLKMNKSISRFIFKVIYFYSVRVSSVYTFISNFQMKV